MRKKGRTALGIQDKGGIRKDVQKEKRKKKLKLGEMTKKRSSEFPGGDLQKEQEKSKILVKFREMTIKKRSSEIFDVNWYGKIFC